MALELSIENKQETSPQRKRIHPHKFTLWVAIASILMMFAGLTSAFIVKSNQAGWRSSRPANVLLVFYGGDMLLSSLTIQMALKAFQPKRNEIIPWIASRLTFLLGILFVVLQWLGFWELWDQQNITFRAIGGSRAVLICDIWTPCFACDRWCHRTYWCFL